MVAASHGLVVVASLAGDIGQYPIGVGQLVPQFGCQVIDAAVAERFVRCGGRTRHHANRLVLVEGDPIPVRLPRSRRMAVPDDRPTHANHNARDPARIARRRGWGTRGGAPGLVRSGPLHRDAHRRERRSTPRYFRHRHRRAPAERPDHDGQPVPGARPLADRRPGRTRHHRRDQHWQPATLAATATVEQAGRLARVLADLLADGARQTTDDSSAVRGGWVGR